MVITSAAARLLLLLSVILLGVSSIPLFSGGGVRLVDFIAPLLMSVLVLYWFAMWRRASRNDASA